MEEYNKNEQDSKESKTQKDTQKKPKINMPKGEKGRNKFVILMLVLILIIMFAQFFLFPGIVIKELKYGEFYSMLIDNRQSGEIVSCELVENQIRGKLRSDKANTNVYFQVNIPPNDTELIALLRQNVPDFTVNPPRVFWRNLVYSLLPVLFLIGFFWFFVYRGAQQGGGRLLSFGKSRARQMNPDKQRITFNDVAGVEEAKEELSEIIDFLKEPLRFQRLGGKIPKGVLLMGPPGSGKTLLAKAVAGEADVPFFSISGSDFVEMFVGVGASRVRDLFEKAKKSAKSSNKGSIIFIDEIDAVGRQRFAGIGGGHDEREQTLNALLVEMDGFNTQEGVILIAATNRPDVLDPALLRPGRFDRQVVVDKPDINGREAIMKVHVRNVKLKADVNLRTIAQRTSGFSGADLANLVNEAALLAARLDKEAVEQTDLLSSIEKVVAGPERKSRVISKDEKKIVAYHEAGHAVTALLLDKSKQIHRITIIPRGLALGYVLHLPSEDRYLKTEKEMLDDVTVSLGGRVAEELVFKEITSGARQDFESATNLARMMVCKYGMSEKLGTVTYGKNESEVFLGRDFMNEKDYSEHTAIVIDEEVKNIIGKCKERARKCLSDNRSKLNSLADTLIDRETLDGDEVRKILGLEGEVKKEDEKQNNGEPSSENVSNV